MNPNYFTSPQFFLDLVIGIVFVNGMALVIAVGLDRVRNNGSRK